MKHIERHETKLLIIVFIILTLVIFHVEGQAQDVIAIDCGDGWRSATVEAPKIIEYFVLVNNRVWTLPAWSKHRDGVTREAFTLRFDNGSEMLVTLSGYLTVKPDSVSRGLLWFNGQPDWRRIGDHDPHPDRLYLLDAGDVVAIRDGYCS